MVVPFSASVSGKERDKTAMDVSRENIHFSAHPAISITQSLQAKNNFVIT